MKYTPQTIDGICRYLRVGNSQRDSALLGGIAESTFYEWMKEAEFSECIKKAELECKARNIAIIQKAAETTWQAGAWWLERKYSSEFALKQINEWQGKNGEPITVQIIGGGFVPPTGSPLASSEGSNLQPQPEVQGASVAPTSPQDNNSNNGVGTPGPS